MTSWQAYDRFKNLLNGSQKETLSVEIINAFMLVRAAEKFKGTEEVVLLHDPSYIRKENTKESEYIGKVRSLDDRIINGYETFNTVAVDSKGSNLTLVSCKPYSNGDKNYIKAEILLEEKRELKEKEYNLNSLTKEALQTTSKQFKEKGTQKVTHVLDRGFDDFKIFEYIQEELNDKFIIRLKSNRNSNEKDEETKKYKKLKNKTYKNSFKKYYDNLTFKGKYYQDAVGNFEYEEIIIEGNKYFIVKVSFYTRNKTAIFKDPMLLITNYNVITDDIAEEIYKKYLMRSKIESVFKFLKDVLGWEEFRVRDFDSIKNLIALCFFIGEYFYEVKSELTHDSTIKTICLLGNGKGKNTRFYFMKGLAKLIEYERVKLFVEENNISKEDFELMLSYVKTQL